MNLTYEVSSSGASGTGTARVEMKFEVAVIPVSDVDRAKHFYTKKMRTEDKVGEEEGSMLITTAASH